MKLVRVSTNKILASVLSKKQYAKLLEDRVSDSGETIYKGTICKINPIRSSKVAELKSPDGEILTISYSIFDKVAKIL